jgi:small GTP-binding protein
MALSCGIVGLPNVGKSTLFNALLKRQIADVANYPFTTIKPHTGVVEVPDENLERLCKLVKPLKCLPATVTFIDIAGLVKNAHKGEGLGNEFLGQIRNVDALVHVVRAFQDSNVPHVEGNVDPARDREIVALELELADIKKPTIEWLNKDKKEFENVDELIRKAYKLLNLITFYTIKGGKEVHAWAIKEGTTALEAAGQVHTDFGQHFIKAEVITVQELLKVDSWKAGKNKGLVRLEGRDYVIADGDVVEFKIGQ